jgi:hypothetical protein
MANLALDKTTNDLIKPSQGQSRVSEGRYTVQQCRSRLQVWLGEWQLDQTQGWLGYDDYGKNIDLFDIETRARQTILGTVGVQAIESMEVLYNNRKLTITFTAKTIYGEISTTVPWGI